MIIDVHTHVYPEKIAAKAVEYIGNFYGLEMAGASGGTPEDLIARMKRAGIDRAVILAVAQVPDQAAKINDFTAAAVRRHEELIGFGTVHRDTENILAEVERIKSIGLRGLKFHPDMQKFNIDDPALDGVYDLMSSLGLPLMLHTGDYRYDYSHPRRVKNIIGKFPSLKVIAAHFGGWSVFDMAAEYIPVGCYVDCSSSFAFLGKKRAAELIRFYGADHVMFGSDYPMWDPGAELEVFESLGLSAEEKRLILSENCRELLGV